MPDPGEVFYLPPERGEALGKGHRPHVLLSRCGQTSDVVTLAYASTQATDALHGAECVLVDPSASPYRGTGLLHPTYVYPSRLLSYASDAISGSAGRIVDEMPEIRIRLTRALGLGTRVTSEGNVPGSNRRGRIVELSPDLAEEWAVRYGLVVTEPGYSRSGYQQTIIPVLDEGCEIRDLDVPLADPWWLQSLGVGYRTAILAVPMVTTVYAPEHIRRYLDLVLHQDSMLLVDEALRTHFGL
jgi:hypothetical protein